MTEFEAVDAARKFMEALEEYRVACVHLSPSQTIAMALYEKSLENAERNLRDSLEALPRRRAVMAP